MAELVVNGVVTVDAAIGQFVDDPEYFFLEDYFMTFMKSALLGSASAMLAIVSANAADLPSRKSAPVE